MVLLNVELDNFYAFKNFHLNLSYPKKIQDSTIREEHLAGRPNFRYKKVNIIMGANASGKTILGTSLRNIFNFIDRKNPSSLLEAISDKSRDASFSVDLASNSNKLYRVSTVFSPQSGESDSAKNIRVEIRCENIWVRDSYESCVSRLEAAEYTPSQYYHEELDRIEPLAWLFEYPRDTSRTIQFDMEDKMFPIILEHVLRALDPTIKKVEMSRDVNNAFVIRLEEESIVLQSGSVFNTNRLSSGTKAGVEIACVLSAILHGRNSFYYCDEKFSYIHSDIERAILSLMIDSIHPNEQLFFTTHNTDLLDMNLPKHTFTFLRKDINDSQHPITCIDASKLLKRSSDSLRNAVENDLFSTAPSVDLIYAISDL